MKTKFSHFALVLFICATLIFLWGRRVNNEIKWMQEQGLPATGTVTYSFVFKAVIHNEVQYQIAGGEVLTARLPWYDSVYLGQNVNLLYSPFNPFAVMLATTTKNSILYFIAGIFATIGLLDIFF